MKKNSASKNKGPIKVAGFQVLENECIWMKAGVVNFRLCDNAYDCITCPFDKGMGKTMKAKAKNRKNNRQPAWAEELRKRYKNDERPCRHVLTGRIDPPKTCPNNYECHHCSFDQWIDENDMVQKRNEPIYQLASGYKLADGYYLNGGHAWASFNHGGFCKVGFDDFLVRLFGPMDSIVLPKIGSKVKQGKVGWEFGRGDKKASVASPVSGTVLSINYRVVDHPTMVNEDPYNEGWLFIVEPEMPKRNLKKLYQGSEGLTWLEQESQKLLGLISPEYEKLAATGGEPIKDVFGSIPELEWETLVETFLNV